MKLISNNGLQFVSADLKWFVKKYVFVHTKTSSYMPIANGEDERAVHTAMDILRQEDPW